MRPRWPTSDFPACETMTKMSEEVSKPVGLELADIPSEAHQTAVNGEGDAIAVTNPAEEGGSGRFRKAVA